jgi:hypothetical protein
MKIKTFTMKKIAFLLLMIAGIASAQTTKNLGDFSQLKVFDQIQVTLVPSTENKIELSGPRSGDVEFVTKNDLLKIRMSIGRTLDGEKVKATLYYKTLNDVDVSEGAYVTGSSTIDTPKMTVNAKEGGQIELNIDVKNIDVRAVTGAIIRLAGTATIMDAKIGTGGVLDAKPLQTEQTTVGINAGGTADVTASELVDASVKAGGDINIYGNPKHVNQKTTFGGSINVKK